MEISLIALIGIALSTMFFGYFFGLFEGRAQGYKRRRREEPPPPAAAVPSVAARLSESNSWLELAAEADGQPRLELDGQLVNTAGLTPAQHKRLIELMVMMRPWVEAAPQAAAAAATAEAAVPLSPRGSLSADVPPAQKNAAASGISAPPAASAGAPGTPGPGEVAAPTSMVTQIDTILQARLQGTPLGSLGIRLAESLKGGAVIFVGKQSYPGVADVPDAQVQAAIREAIAEWEKRFTPG